MISGALPFDIEDLYFEDINDHLEVKEDDFEETNGTMMISGSKSIIWAQHSHQEDYPFNDFHYNKYL